MAFKLADRVRETSVTTGTGALALAGAVTGYRTFASVLADGDTCYYAVILGSDFETGIGTYSASGNTLSRTSIYESSNGGALVNFASGVKNVVITLPAKATPFKGSGALLRALADDTLFVTAKAVADAIAPVALGSITGTQTLDLTSGITFTGTVTGALTLANPTTYKLGCKGLIVLTTGAANCTLAVGSMWKRDGGPPTMSTASGAIDFIAYEVISAGLILYSYGKAVS